MYLCVYYFKVVGGGVVVIRVQVKDILYFEVKAIFLSYKHLNILRYNIFINGFYRYFIILLLLFCQRKNWNIVLLFTWNCMLVDGAKSTLRTNFRYIFWHAFKTVLSRRFPDLLA